MPIIYLELTPDEIEIKSILNHDEDEPSEDKIRSRIMILLKGKLTYSGVYKYSKLEFINGDKEINLPENFSIRITEKKTHNNFHRYESIFQRKSKSKSAIGILYYFDARKDDEMGDTPEEFHADITVNSIQFENYIRLIQSKKSKLIASVPLRDNAPNDALKADINWRTYDAIWDIGKADYLKIYDFYFSTIFENDINKEPENSKAVKTQDTQRDQNSLILSQLAHTDAILSKLHTPLWLIFIVLCFILLRRV